MVKAVGKNTEHGKHRENILNKDKYENRQMRW